MTVNTANASSVKSVSRKIKDSSLSSRQERYYDMSLHYNTQALDELYENRLNESSDEMIDFAISRLSGIPEENKQIISSDPNRQKQRNKYDYCRPFHLSCFSSSSMQRKIYADQSSDTEKSLSMFSPNRNLDLAVSTSSTGTSPTLSKSDQQAFSRIRLKSNDSAISKLKKNIQAKYEQQIKDYEKKLSSLTQEVANMKSANEMMKTKFDEQERVIGDFKSKMETLSISDQQLNRDNDNLKNQLKSLELVETLFRSENEKLSDENNRLSHKLKLINERMGECRTRLSESSELLNQTTNTCQQIKNQQLKQRDADVEELTQVVGMIEAMQDSFAKEFVTVRDQLKDRSQKYRQLSQAYELLEEQIEEKDHVLELLLTEKLEQLQYNKLLSCGVFELLPNQPTVIDLPPLNAFGLDDSAIKSDELSEMGSFDLKLAKSAVDTKTKVVVSRSK